MLIKKKINNNFAVAIDNGGNEIIVMGKGVGFPKTPYSLEDLSIIDSTFYAVDTMYQSMITSFPESVATIASRILKLVEHNVDTTHLNPNLFFILMDHINFCIEREKKGIYINMPIQYDLLQLYPIEVSIGKQALQIVWEVEHIRLDEVEAYGIAMNIINGRETSSSKLMNAKEEKAVIEKMIEIIERECQQKIKRDDFNYSRFAMHVHYLLARMLTKEELNVSIKEEMVKEMKKSYPLIWKCVNEIFAYLNEYCGVKGSDDEKFYLTLHINRVTNRKI